MSDRPPALTDDTDPLAGVWADPMGQWTADQADAARATLDAARKRLASLARPAAATVTSDMVDDLWDSLNESTNQGTDPYTYADVERAVRDVVHEARRLAQQRPQRDLTEPSAGVENLTEPDRSPEAWVRRFKALPLVEQVVAARAVLENARRRWECDADAHRRWVREGREAGWLPPRPPILVTDSDGEGSETPR